MVPAVAHRVALAPGPGSHSCYRCCQQGHWPWKDLVRFGKIIWNALTCLEMWRLICTPWIFSNRLTLQRFHEPMGFGCLWGPGVDPFDMFRRKWICFASAMSFYLQFLTKAIPISLIVLGSLISLISALPTAHWSKGMPHASINRGPTIDRPYTVHDNSKWNYETRQFNPDIYRSTKSLPSLIESGNLWLKEYVWPELWLRCGAHAWCRPLGTWDVPGLGALREDQTMSQNEVICQRHLRA
jgi:hypothetical protein